MRPAAPFSLCLGAIPDLLGWLVPGLGSNIGTSQGPRWRCLLRILCPHLERSSGSRSQSGHAPTSPGSAPGGGREAAQSAFKWGYLKREPGGKWRNQFPKWEGGVLFLYSIGYAA